MIRYLALAPSIAGHIEACPPPYIDIYSQRITASFLEYRQVPPIRLDGILHGKYLVHILFEVR